MVISIGPRHVTPLAYAKDPNAYRFATIALAENPLVRSNFERGLTAKLREHDYDAVSSYNIVQEITEVNDTNFVQRLTSNDIVGALIIRLAAVGPGSSLESVRDDVPTGMFLDMKEFAGELTSTKEDELIAVLHMAFYMFNAGKVTLISAGAVWLDEPVENRAEAVDRLQNLVVTNLDRVRPKFRKHMGLDPLD